MKKMIRVSACILLGLIAYWGMIYFIGMLAHGTVSMFDLGWYASN